MDGKITDKAYYKEMQKLMKKIKNNSKKKKYVLQYGIHGLNWFYRFLVESRFLGYVFLKYFGNDSTSIIHRFKNKMFPDKMRMPYDDQEFVLEEFAKLSKQYKFRLIFSPEIKRKDSHIEAYDQYAERMRCIARKYNIEVLDLSPVIRSYPEDRFFLPNDCMHFSPFGHRVIANTLLHSIIKQR